MGNHSDAVFCLQALAYATRHLAWSGAAVTTLCQCRFRKLLVGLDDAPAANANVNLQTYYSKSVAERRAVPTEREYWENICGEEQADIYYPSPSPGQHSPPAKLPCGRAHPQYAPPDRRRRESRRVGEAHGQFIFIFVWAISMTSCFVSRSIRRPPGRLRDHVTAPSPRRRRRQRRLHRFPLQLPRRHRECCFCVFSLFAHAN